MRFTLTFQNEKGEWWQASFKIDNSLPDDQDGFTVMNQDSMLTKIDQWSIRPDDINNPWLNCCVTNVEILP